MVFLQTDPLGSDGGNANLYDYARQDPINGSDLTGQCFMGLCHVVHAFKRVWHHAEVTLHHDVASPIWRHRVAIGQGLMIAGLAATGWGISMDMALAVGDVGEMATSETLMAGARTVARSYISEAWRRNVSFATITGVGMMYGGYRLNNRRWLW